jgi:sporulation protein YlmC with PRC-barrel domain
MLQVISALKGFAIVASDGRIGSVSDFLFDEVTWNVRWLVVDCGTWMKGRKVLIPPAVVIYAGLEHEYFEVKLTMAQVEGSPSLAEHEPVSRQMETLLYDHYGVAPDWSGTFAGGVMGVMASPILTPPYLGFQMRPAPHSTVSESQERGDPHLRSVNEVIGYRIHAADGDIGHVENFMFDNETWGLPYFVVDVSNWWFGNRVLISTQAVTSIDWTERHVRIGASREQVRTSPLWDPLVAFTDIKKTLLHEHYGWPGAAA